MVMPFPCFPHSLISVLVDMEFYSLLEREYLFIDAISTFLRTTHAETISVHDGSFLFARRGHLKVDFDICVKVFVAILREEGLMGDNNKVIMTVVIKAVQEVRQHLSLTRPFLT